MSGLAPLGPNSQTELLLGILAAVLRKTGPVEITHEELGSASMDQLTGDLQVGHEPIGGGVRFGVVQ